MRLKMKNRSHGYDTNGTRPKHGHKYSKFKMCLIIMMVIENLSNTETELNKKRCL